MPMGLLFWILMLLWLLSWPGWGLWSNDYVSRGHSLLLFILLLLLGWNTFGAPLR